MSETQLAIGGMFGITLVAGLTVVVMNRFGWPGLMVEGYFTLWLLAALVTRE